MSTATSAASTPRDALGFPASGRGSIASTGSRCAAVLIDAVLGYLVGLAVSVLAEVRPHGSCPAPTTAGTLCHTVAHADFVRNVIVSVALLVMVALLLALTGRTVGMIALKLQLVRLDGRRVGWVALPRTVLMAFLFPPLLIDRHGRALHDRAVGTVVVRTG